MAEKHQLTLQSSDGEDITVGKSFFSFLILMGR